MFQLTTRLTDLALPSANGDNVMMAQFLKGAVIRAITWFDGNPTLAVTSATEMFADCLNLVSLPFFTQISGVGGNLGTVTTLIGASDANATLSAAPPIPVSAINCQVAGVVKLSDIFGPFSGSVSLRFSGSGSIDKAPIIPTVSKLLVWEMIISPTFTITGTGTQVAANNMALTDDRINALFTSLPVFGGTIDVRANPGSRTCNAALAQASGWTVLTV
jgi:hypothetical protein